MTGNTNNSVPSFVGSTPTQATPSTSRQSLDAPWPHAPWPLRNLSTFRFPATTSEIPLASLDSETPSGTVPPNPSETPPRKRIVWHLILLGILWPAQIALLSFLFFSLHHKSGPVEVFFIDCFTCSPEEKKRYFDPRVHVLLAFFSIHLALVVFEMAMRYLRSLTTAVYVYPQAIKIALWAFLLYVAHHFGTTGTNERKAIWDYNAGIRGRLSMADKEAMLQPMEPSPIFLLWLALVLVLAYFPLVLRSCLEIKPKCEVREPELSARGNMTSNDASKSLRRRRLPIV